MVIKFRTNKRLYSFISLLFCFTLSVNAASDPKHILALYSYDATYSTYTESEQALNDAFPPSNYIVDVEFLDSKRYAKGELNQTVFDRIKIKQENQNGYDIVIAGNDNALKFCIDFQEQLFSEVPIIFWGINNLEVAYEQDKNPWITGFIDDIYASETLDLLVKIHPNINEFVIIKDNTATGEADYYSFFHTTKNYPDLNFEYYSISDHSMDEFDQFLESSDKNKIILVLSATRSKDRYLDLDEANMLFKKYASKNIYNLFLFDPGFGINGGRRVNFYEHILPACLLAKQILNGMPVDLVRVTSATEKGNLFLDYKRMTELGVDLSTIPPHVQIVNEPVDNVRISKDTMIIVMIGLFTFFMFLFFLLYILNAKRKLEKSLRINAENFSSIFKNNHSIMLIVDPQTRKITDANKAACKFYGYSYDEFKQLEFKQISMLPEIDTKNILNSILQKNIQAQFKHKLKNGEIRDVELHAGRIELHEDIFLYIIIHNISDRVKYFEELIEARKKAEESDNLKSAFLANMSHEIRTPMNSILGFSSLLVDDGADPVTRNKYLGYIQSNGEHLLNLIDDIINLSKIEANQLSIKINDCKVNQLLDDINILFKNQIHANKKNNIQLKLEKGVLNPDFNIKTDPVRLKQILLNLLSNALKFTDNGEIEFGYKFREDSMIQFYVKDTGIGIPEHKIHSIFSPFEQVEEIITRSHGGTGLGLSITKSLVEKLGGHIWVVSKLGEGSRFYFTISATSNLLNLN